MVFFLEKNFFHFSFVLVSLIEFGDTVQCYKCLKNNDKNCNGQVCSAGLFGCVKSVTYNGGVDPSGAQKVDPRYQWVAYKDCAYLPWSGVEGCSEQILLGGIRIVTCHCNTDFCNGHEKNLPKGFLCLLSILSCLFLSSWI